MLNKLMAFREAYLKNEDGATAIEYGLIAAGVALAIITIVFTMGGNISDTFTTVSDKISEQNAAAQ